MMPAIIELFFLKKEATEKPTLKSVVELKALKSNQNQYRFLFENTYWQLLMS